MSLENAMPMDLPVFTYTTGGRDCSHRRWKMNMKETHVIVTDGSRVGGQSQVRIPPDLAGLAMKTQQP